MFVTVYVFLMFFVFCFLDTNVIYVASNPIMSWNEAGSLCGWHIWSDLDGTYEQWLHTLAPYVWSDTCHNMAWQLIGVDFLCLWQPTYTMAKALRLDKLLNQLAQM